MILASFKGKRQARKAWITFVDAINRGTKDTHSKGSNVMLTHTSKGPMSCAQFSDTNLQVVKVNDLVNRENGRPKR